MVDVKRVLSEINVGHIIEKKRKLVTVEFGQEISTVLCKLAESRVHSALIVDPDKPWEVFGFVDVLDILYHLLDSSAWSCTDFGLLQWESKVFSRKEAWEVSNQSGKNPLILVSYETKLADVMVHFAKGVHRLAVEENSVVVNVISQTDVVRYLSSISSSLDPVINKQLVEIGLPALGAMKNTWIFNERMRVLDALKYMKDENISGGAVIDQTGKIVSNFSASDLVGITEANFAWITLPVLQFLQRIHHGVLKAPVTCRVDDKLEFVLLKLSAYKVYRIYLVNDTFQPNGVLTLTDIIRFFLPDFASSGIGMPKEILLPEFTATTEVSS